MSVITPRWPTIGINVAIIIVLLALVVWWGRQRAPVISASAANGRVIPFTRARKQDWVAAAAKKPEATSDR